MEERKDGRRAKDSRTEGRAPNLPIFHASNQVPLDTTWGENRVCSTNSAQIVGF